MMSKILPSFSQSSLIKLKDQHWLERQRQAGSCVAQCLKHSRNLIRQVTPHLSLKKIEQECLNIITAMDCSPTFLGYKGFPGAICASVNHQLVHGIPSDYVLQEGDVVKIDLGASYQGAIADAAITEIYGNPRQTAHVELVTTCRAALHNAITNLAVGKQLGVIGSSIHHVVKKTRFGLITEYGGHGIDENIPHAEPFVSNKSPSLTGVRLQPGMTLAIEPMLVMGETRTWVSSDGWTVNTSDVGAHFEHTIYLSASGTQILTSLE